MPERTQHRIEGNIQLESVEKVPANLELMAYVFDERHRLLSTGSIQKKGDFKVEFILDTLKTVVLFISPAADEKDVRGAASYCQKIGPKDWQKEGRSFLIKPEIFLPRDLWRPWWPQRICVSGHVRKVGPSGDTAGACPVPYVKVEVFDVDREGCWWPYIVRWWDDLLDRPVFRVPELLKEPPERPRKFPDPPPIGPIARLGRPSPRLSVPAESANLNLAEKRAINPQPEPPAWHVAKAAITRLGPQPEPPDLPAENQHILHTAATIERVGEAGRLAQSAAQRLDKLSLSSKIAPWNLFRWCFYSKEKVCETFTDCDGYFRCCFSWWPWHFRRGRLRLDLRPDIILKITQIIDGRETVIYLDPYTSTRWNFTTSHLDLYLDDEEIVCGVGCGPQTELDESQATVLQVGRDEVWKINKTDGMYTVPPASNGAYGGTLVIRGDFSTNLKSGTPTRYYRLSYAKTTGSGATPADSAFTPIARPLTVLRATFSGSFETYNLGPKTVNSTPALYEVQDTAHWWITPWESVPHLTVAGGMVLGLWATTGFESHQGTYILRMVVYDENGVKLAATQFPNHAGDGTGDDPDPVPIETDQLDLKIHIDNKPMHFHLEVDPSPGEKCGIIKWTSIPPLTFRVLATQENGRVHWWSLNYVKGMNPTEIHLDDETYPSGTASVNQAVNGLPLLVDTTTLSGDLEESCAFALILRARSHVRVNHGWHWYPTKEYAIAIEKCPPCPVVT
ncbi:MAG: hypothetical protein WBG37_18950 [Desulfobacterales bacterium]